MKNVLTASGIGLALLTTSICSAQTTSTSAGASSAPYTEGPVWVISMIRTKPGMEDDYLKSIANSFKKSAEEAKQQGLVMDYKVLIGDAANREDFNIVLMTEYKNDAAFDGLRDKMEPIMQKVLGNADSRRDAAVKRMDIREIVGAKRMREITLK